MKRLNITIIIAVLFMMTMAGCAPVAITGAAKVDQAAFGANKKFAVVSIASIKKFQGEKGLSQTFKKVDEIPGASTQPILYAVSPEVITTFKKSGHFSLVPESRVLNSKAYKRAKEDERIQKVLIFKSKIITPKKYKYFSDPEKLTQLAKDLKVDGVITVLMSFSIRTDKSWISVGGVTLGKKKYSVIATVTTIAYDQEGKRIWKDTTIRQAEPGDTKMIILLDFTDMTKTKFQKLHPSAITLGTKAVGDMHARFSDSLNGKKGSIFQKMK